MRCRRTPRRAGWWALPAATALLALCPAAGLAAPARHPRARPATELPAQPPFGASYEAVCGPAPRGSARCLADVLTVGGATSPGTATPLITATPLGYGPADLQDAYGIVSEAATAGSSQTVALVDAYDDPTAEADLATYRTHFGLSACTTANGCFRKVNERGGTSYPAQSGDWAGEISLDLDAVSAICPRCHLLLVEADSSYIFDLAASVDEAATLGATQISNSYGNGEFAGDTSFDADYDHPGIAITASSGDDGYGVSFPASSPYVTAVGGTSLTPAPSVPRGWSEAAWAGGGSGCSVYESKPAWQLDSGCATRTVADVSAVADPATGAAVYSSSNGGWLVFGGTSLASPIVAAYDALVGAAAASPQYPYAHLGSYYDITSGTNGSCGNYLCTALGGYDGPTGLGTPHGAGLLRSPTVGTGTATTVTGSSETVKGTVDPNGYLTSYHFEYGTTTMYGTSTTPASAGSDSSVHLESASLTGLAASTTYHFRIVATNANGTRDGADNIFTSGGGLPVPTNTVTPIIAGLPQVGATLAVSTGTWTGLPTEYAYQWWHCVWSGGSCTPSTIAGATAATYTAQSSDIGATVYVAVRARNANGWSGDVISGNAIGPISAPVPANTTAPHVSGGGQVGSALSAASGTWTGAPSTYGYQWWHCLPVSGGGCLPSAISGATTSAYTLTSGDLGGLVWLAVRAQNANGWSSFVNSDNAIGPVTSVPPVTPSSPGTTTVTPASPTPAAPGNAVAPHVSGTPIVGATVSASAGTWTGAPDAFDYRWLDCMPVLGGGCTPTQVGTTAGYLVAASDVSGTLYVQVRAHNAGGWSAFVASDNTLGPVTAPSIHQPVVVAPSLTHLALHPTAFRAARKGASVAAGGGARVAYTVSTTAYSSFTVERVLPGRRIGGQCMAPSAGNRRRPSCTRTPVLPGSFRYPAGSLAAAGLVAFHFTGRLGGKALAAGPYRLVAIAVGSTGARSAPAQAAFQILR